MVLAAALGLAGDAFRRDGWPLPAVDPGKLALVGVRSLDDGERRAAAARLDAKVFTMSEVDRIGVEPCMREALAHASGAAFLHVSLDMDVVDPDYAPGVGTPVRGGLSYREAHLAMETVAESGARSTRWTSSRSTRSSTARTRPGSSPSSSWRRRSARASSSCDRRARRSREGDIAAVEADAMANAANDRLWMGAGVAGALEAGGRRGDRAGGDGAAGRSRSGPRLRRLRDASGALGRSTAP